MRWGPARRLSMRPLIRASEPVLVIQCRLPWHAAVIWQQLQASSDCGGCMQSLHSSSRALFQPGPTVCGQAGSSLQSCGRGSQHVDVHPHLRCLLQAVIEGVPPCDPAMPMPPVRSLTLHCQHCRTVTLVTPTPYAV
jgi:hypothetical protein